MLSKPSERRAELNSPKRAPLKNDSRQIMAAMT
jgi:hypothetical protein